MYFIRDFILYSLLIFHACKSEEVIDNNNECSRYSEEEFMFSVAQPVIIQRLSFFEKCVEKVVDEMKRSKYFTQKRKNKNPSKPTMDFNHLLESTELSLNKMSDILSNVKEGKFFQDSLENIRSNIAEINQILVLEILRKSASDLKEVIDPLVSIMNMMIQAKRASKEDVFKGIEKKDDMISILFRDFISMELDEIEDEKEVPQKYHAPVIFEDILKLLQKESIDWEEVLPLAWNIRQHEKSKNVQDDNDIITFWKHFILSSDLEKKKLSDMKLN
uniref:Uncharacterized protein n=1 Tax=Lepeophtheirus salmonis TaxID=72036 RepID=A0A0K2UA69_LEPSM